MFSSMKDVSLALENIEKPDEAGDSSSFSCLPDEILLHILNRLLDLKALCICQLVSLRFNQIVHQVNVISFTAADIDHPSSNSNTSDAPNKPDDPVYIFKSMSFVSAMKSMKRFSGLKSLCIEIPPSVRVADSHYLFKWMLKFGDRSNSFVFLSPNSITDKKANVEDEEEEDMELNQKKILISKDCLVDAHLRLMTLLCYIKCFPLLEKLTITDIDKRGRISLGGGNIAELRNWFSSSHETIEQMMKTENCYKQARWCYAPLLELPISGYVMKGVSLLRYEMDEPSEKGEGDSFNTINLNDFEDKEEAAYSEAVTEMLKKHRGRIVIR